MKEVMAEDRQTSLVFGMNRWILVIWNIIIIALIIIIIIIIIVIIIIIIIPSVTAYDDQVLSTDLWPHVNNIPASFQVTL